MNFKSGRGIGSGLFLKLGCAASLLIVLVLLPLTGRSQDDGEHAPTGQVQLVIRSPDGKPLVEGKVLVTETGNPFPRDNGPKEDLTTDRDGVVKFPWPSGYHVLRVVCPGIGFGATGVLRVKPDGQVRFELPPLAPFATIEGTIVPALRRPDMKAHRFGMGTPGWTEVFAPCNDTGQFKLTDVIPGECWVTASNPDKTVASEQTPLWIYPGQHLTGVSVVGPRAPEDPESSPLQVRRNRPEDEDVEWAEGFVRDPAGKPVSGADVFVIGDFHGGIRMYQEIKAVTTDADGHYRATGRGGWSVFSASVVAHKAGFPPAFAWVSDSPARDPGDATTRPLISTDLVLAASGGRLRVAVTKNGKPATGATVALEPRDAPGLYEAGYMGAARGNEREQFDPILTPSMTAGDDGVAVFENLHPGVYRVTASEGQNRVGWPFDGDGPAAAYNVAESVPVPADAEQKLSISIYPQANRIHVKLHPASDGVPPPKDVGFEFGPAVTGTQSSTSVQPNGDGVVQYGTGNPGLWALQFSYRDVPLRWSPDNQEPRYVASGVFAASPLFQDLPPAELTAVRHEPGSIAVQILDRDGNPTPGVVVVEGFGGEPEQAGSTDADGHIRFESMGSGTYRLLVSAPAVGPLLDSTDLTVIPPDSQLQNKSCFFVQTAKVDPDKQTSLTVRPTPVGFVHGHVRPKPGLSPKDYYVSWFYSEANGGLVHRYDPKTGEYVYGPLESGKAYIELRRVKPDPASANPPVFTPEIQAGKVVNLDLPWDAPPDPHHSDSEQVMLGMGGITERGSQPRGLDAVILMPDGRTPAFGATLAVYSPTVWSPVAGGITDALGHAHFTGTWRSGDEPKVMPPGSPADPVIAAWLPGVTGPVMASLASHPTSLKLVLPRPLSAHGTVTVGGQPITGLNARFRVLAAYQGHGKLDGIFSLEPTVQADGSFVLSGLSPGTYRVQAAMDNIWLSSTAEVRVTDAGPPPLSLDIGPPGVPLVVKLTDAQGKPAVDQVVTLDRPPGPLTDLTWPAEFSSDGAGEICIQGLEAGSVKLRAGQVATTVDVPKLSKERNQALAVPMTVKSN